MCPRGAKAVPAAFDQFGVLVVDEPGRPGRLLLILAVRQLRTGRQHLHLDPRPLHQPQPGLQLGTAAGPEAARHDRAGLAQVHQQIDIVLGPVVRAYRLQWLLAGWLPRPAVDMKTGRPAESNRGTSCCRTR